MTEPVLSGTVTPEGIDWVVSGIHASEMFWRQLRFREFDISEMSLSSLAIAAANGVRDWTAIPVFTTRRFFHTGILVRKDAGIAVPADLKGKRVGVGEYQQTAAVWTRGALQHEFGVLAQDMTWFMERPPEMSHGGATAFRPPPGVGLTYLSRQTNIGKLLASGQLDASITYSTDRNLVDRSRDSPAAMSNVRHLFADRATEEARYYAQVRFLPVNHVVVIRTELFERHPWIAVSVFAAFTRAKQAVIAPLADQLEPWRQIGVMPDIVARRIGQTDPLPYGLARQALVFDVLGGYLHEQGLTGRKIDITSLFAFNTLDL